MKRIHKSKIIIVLTLLLVAGIKYRIPDHTGNQGFPHRQESGYLFFTLPGAEYLLCG